MGRKVFIGVATILVITTITLTFIASFYFARERVIYKENERLRHLGERTIKRTEQSFDEILTVLKSLNTAAGKPCSPAGLTLIRQVTLATKSVDEIGYVENGKLLCSSWGNPSHSTYKPSADFISTNGLQVKLDYPSTNLKERAMIDIQYGNYVARIHPSRLADITTDDGVSIVVRTANGYFLGALHELRPAQMQLVIGGNEPLVSNDRLSIITEKSGLRVVVSESLESALKRVREEQIFIFPFAIVFAVLISATIVLFSLKRLSLRGDLAVAVKRREFMVHYQPLIDLRSGTCVGAEALVRWKRSNHEFIRPDIFIPVAEETGLIQAITDQVIQTIICELSTLLASDRNLHIAINLSAMDVTTGRVLDFLEKEIAGTKIERQQIWLEVTEREFTDIDAASVTLDRARRLGYFVAIDDFGTGYSTLSHLQKLPLDALKIDKSFVDTIGTDSATSTVTPHIVAMAKTLSLQTVAEGVETKEQLEYLLQQGVEYGQGWLFAKAMPAEHFIQFHKERTFS